MFWLSWIELAFPLRAQLSAIVFEKAMRRKNVKTAAKKRESKKVEDGRDETNGNSTSGDDNDKIGEEYKSDGKVVDKKDEKESEDEDDAGQKSRQGTLTAL
jgi:hypothetical protein